jgi:hypothetical protein
MKKSLIAKLSLVALSGLLLYQMLPGGITQAQMYYAGSFNARPVWQEIPYVSVNQGSTLNLSVTATDNEVDPLTFSSITLPEGAVFNSITRTFSFTPNYSQFGTYPVTLSVTDNRGDAIYKTFYVGVTSDSYHFNSAGGALIGSNRAPYFNNNTTYHQATSGNSLTFKVSALDPEGRSVFYRISELPRGASFIGANGEFRWTPDYSDRGVYTMQFIADDGQVSSAPLNVTIVVNGGTNSVINNQIRVSNTNAPYFTTSPLLTAVANQTYVYDANAYSSNNSQITFGLAYGPNGAFVNPVTGVFAWTAPADSANGQTYQFAITASDGFSTPATQAFTLTVTGGKTVNTIVQYVPARTTSVPVTNYVTSNAQVTYVNAGQTIATNNFVTSGQTSYDRVGGVRGFNIKLAVNEDNQTVATWDTTKPARAEVVFGFSSQTSSRILNYDFTSGQGSDFGTVHSMNLGELKLNTTYHLRMISRTGSETDISEEIIFIPMPFNQQVVGSNNNSSYTGSAVNTVGSGMGSSWFIFLLILIILALVIYLLATPTFISKTTAHEEELPELEIHGSHH